MTFKQKLDRIVKKNNSLLCVGLDSQLNKIPIHIKTKKNPMFEFNKAIIDATHDLICAYKPNIAFYEAEGLDGLLQLKFTTKYLKDKYPDIPIIIDAKRADIGNTNIFYAKFIFEFLQADAVTLHPYMGKESLKPFLDLKDKGIFILCRTSNPGAGEFQDLLVTESDKDTSEVAKAIKHLGSGRQAHSARHDSPDGEGTRKPLYQVVAEHVAKDWNYNGNCGLVVGAPYPAELNIVRHITGEGFPLLIPGIGTQGGDVEKTVKGGIDKDGLNAIINSSRSIIFASSGIDFAQKAREEAKRLKNLINKFRR